MNEVVVAEKRIIFRHISYVRGIVPIVWNDMIDKISCPHIFFLLGEVSVRPCPRMSPDKAFVMLVCDILPRRVFDDAFVVSFMELHLFWYSLFISFFFLSLTSTNSIYPMWYFIMHDTFSLSRMTSGLVSK
ncbi:hypothetical protein CDAR_282401 [Caerostris darwini]|uniref:SAC domain-containing protein n=1 Tax=Caerostris darwini TaxID=1538125 RepID=A0AAV4MS53_9ARAC|nr:hypothetical protein CDAR_282401 [Caerostris darwini]